MAPTDYIVEDEADEPRGHVVNMGRGRHEAHVVEGDWEIDILEETYSELLVQYPLKQRRKDARKEEKNEAIIQLTLRQ